MKVDLNDLSQSFVAIGVLEMLERGYKIHDVMDMVSEITKQVWYGYQDEQREEQDAKP